MMRDINMFGIETRSLRIIIGMTFAAKIWTTCKKSLFQFFTRSFPDRLGRSYCWWHEFKFNFVCSPDGLTSFSAVLCLCRITYFPFLGSFFHFDLCIWFIFVSSAFGSFLRGGLLLRALPYFFVSKWRKKYENTKWICLRPCYEIIEMVLSGWRVAK